MFRTEKHLKLRVQWEAKSAGKADPKILALCWDRLEVLSHRGEQLKLDRSLPLLDVRQVSLSPDCRRVTLRLDNGETAQFSCRQQQAAVRAAAHTLYSLQLRLPHLPAGQLPELLPPPSTCCCLPPPVADRRRRLRLTATPAGARRCGGFSSAYSLLCRYRCHRPRPELVWDVDTLCWAQGRPVLRLGELDMPGAPDLPAVVAALAFCPAFVQLSASGVAFSPQMLRSLEMVLTFNCTLEVLDLSNCGLKAEFAKIFSAAVARNDACCLSSLDLSHNQLGDEKCIERLGPGLAKLGKQLRSLHMRSCCLSVKAAIRLCDILHGNCTRLQSLRLDGNDPSLQSSVFHKRLRPGASESMQKLLSGCADLQDLSCCSLGIEHLALALATAPAAGLTSLDLSRCALAGANQQAAKLNWSWSGLLRQCPSLRCLRLNSCRLAAPALAELLRALADSAGIADFRLHLAGNQLGLAGANTLCAFFAKRLLNCLTELDLADNCFEDTVVNLVQALSSSNLRHLAIGGDNFKTRDANVVTQFSEIVTGQKCRLQSLSLANARLRDRTTILANALAQCENLKKLDIAGNSMGDLGAKVLAKSLSVNTSLEELLLDDNQLGVAGLRDLAAALSINCRLRLLLPLPARDIARLLQTDTDTAAILPAVDELQRCLWPRLADSACRYQRPVSARDYLLRCELTSCLPAAEQLAAKTEAALLGPSFSTTQTEAPESVRAAVQAAAEAAELPSGLAAFAVAAGEQNDGVGVGAELGHRLRQCLSDEMSAARHHMLQHLSASCPQLLSDHPQLLLSAGEAATERLAVAEAEAADSLVRQVGRRLLLARECLKLEFAAAINEFAQRCSAQGLMAALDSMTSNNSNNSNNSNSSSRQVAVGSRRPLSLFSDDRHSPLTSGVGVGDVVGVVGSGSGSSRRLPRAPAPLPRRPPGPRKRPPAALARGAAVAGGADAQSVGAGVDDADSADALADPLPETLDGDDDDEEEEEEPEVVDDSKALEEASSDAYSAEADMLAPDTVLPDTVLPDTVLPDTAACASSRQAPAQPAQRPTAPAVRPKPKAAAAVAAVAAAAAAVAAAKPTASTAAEKSPKDSKEECAA